MYLDFQPLADLLQQDPVLTYPLRQHLFFSPMPSNTRIWFRDNAVVVLGRCLQMYGAPSGLDAILGQLEPGEYKFFGVPVKYLPILDKHFTAISREEDASAYTLDKQDFPGHLVETLDSLTQDDAEYVDSHWSYRYQGSIHFFRHIIATYPSSAIRIDGKLAGWAVCYDTTADMTNLGSLRVLEQYRNRGLGKKLALDLAAKVLERGKTPLVHILDDNLASRALSMAIGFKPYPEKIFWGQGIKM